MDLHIFGLSKILAHIPEKSTYLIRIFSSGYEYQEQQFPLQASENWREIKKYIFDDNDYHFRLGSMSIDDTIATKIVSEFAVHKDSVESLVVHCSRGKNRSPAVAMALNELFNLGHDPHILLAQYAEFNRLVYDNVKSAGKKLILR